MNIRKAKLTENGQDTIQTEIKSMKVSMSSAFKLETGHILTKRVGKT